jgi:hypothetical protein
MRMLPTSGTTPAIHNKHTVLGKPSPVKQIRHTQACTTASRNRYAACRRQSC